MTGKHTRRKGTVVARRKTAVVQAGLARLARRLQELEGQARALRRAIPGSARRAAMQEDEIPPDVATELVAAIECLIADCVKPATRIAREASRLTEATLEREWRKRQRERAASLNPGAQLPTF